MDASANYFNKCDCVCSHSYFFTPLPEVIFNNISIENEILYQALFLICLIFFSLQHLTVFEAAQLANQKQDRYNIATTIGTLVAAFAVYITAQHAAASVFSILIAAHLPVLLMRFFNAQWVWIELRPQLFWLSAKSWIQMQRLLRDGIHFISGTSISNFLCHPFSILVVGAFSSALSTASFAAVMNAVILAASVFGLIMTPFRGALPEAKQRNDISWIRRVYGLILVFNLGYALAACILFAVFGEWLFFVWYQGTISPSPLLLSAAGVYILCLAVEATNSQFLV
ncbi:MAG: hypothetical protein MZV65_07010 [Chromatiales bacterium]|nr:hypothetical protein [Chromatiales bacterium]